jgi:hypothetical protein
MPSGHLSILKRKAYGDYELRHAIQARGAIYSATMNSTASILATVCYFEGKVELWDIEKGELVCPTFITY